MLAIYKSGSSFDQIQASFFLTAVSGIKKVIVFNLYLSHNFPFSSGKLFLISFL